MASGTLQLSPSSGIPLRPLDLSDILDGIFRIYRNHFALFASVALALVIPGLVINLALGTWHNGLTGFTTTPDTSGTPGSVSSQFSGVNVAAIAIAGAVGIILLPLNYGALAYAGVKTVSGQPTSFGDVILGTLRRYFPLLAMLVVTVLVAMSFILCLTIPLVIWVLVRWAVGVPALVAEGVGPMAALGRSWRLVQSRWWRTFGILLLVIVMQVVISYGLTALFAGLAVALPASNDVRGLLTLVASTFVGALVNPITSIALVLLYFDLRMRREALDLQQLALQSTAGLPPAPARSMPPPPPPPGAAPPPPPPSS
jgi:hypothetical protein